MDGHSVHRGVVCALSDFPILFTSDGSSVNLLVSQTHSWVWDLIFFFFARSCWLFRCWFCGLWDWPKEHFCDLSFSWIFSCLLVFSKIIFSCTVHHWGWVCSYCFQILWIVHTMRDFRVRFERVPLMCDNTSVISVAKNLVFHRKMRHVEMRYHFSEISCREGRHRDEIHRHRETVVRHFHQTPWFFSICWFVRGNRCLHPYD
jgi:hypothetical protein